MRSWTSACRGIGLRPESAPLPRFEAAKYWLRSCWQGKAHLQWMRFLREEPRMRGLVATSPHLLWKLQRAYLHPGLSLRDKLACLVHHHRWALARLPHDALQAVHGRSGWMLAELALPDVTLVFGLEAPERYAKEGEWVLTLRSDGRQVAAVAFTVRAWGLDRCAHIGCLQGGETAGQRDLVKTVTKALHGLRPKQAVIVALYALLAALGVPQVLAVGNDSHVYQARLRRRGRIQADYDGFWQELGGWREDRRHWRLPTRMARKVPEDVPSKHRAQVRRRQALEDLVQGCIQERVAQACGARSA